MSPVTLLEPVRPEFYSMAVGLMAFKVPPVWTTKDYHHLTPGARVPVRHNHTGAG